MTDNITSAPPLTRREAREIERKTGQRPIARPVAPSAALAPVPAAAQPSVFDTARIEPNDKLALVSVMPTEVIDRVAVKRESLAPEVTTGAAGAFARPTSIRAAKPAALVTRARRRTTVGLGVAASAAVLATAAVAAPGALGGQDDQQQASQASLVTNDDVVVDEPNVPAAGQSQTATVPAADLVAAPEVAPDRAEYTVTSFEPGDLEEATTTIADTSADTATDSTDGETPTASGSGGADLSGIGAIADSMVGGGSGWLCTDFTRAVYAEAGIDLPGNVVSAQAAGGTQTSDPQVGDLVVFNSGHIGIYAGGGMMWDNPGYPSSNVGWQNVHRSIDVIGSSYYFVTYR